MHAVTETLGAVATLLLAFAGVLLIAGTSSWKPVLRYALAALALTFLLPYGAATVSARTEGVSCAAGPSPDAAWVAPIAVGHLVLAVLLLRRRAQAKGRASAARDDEERSRSRERQRLPPEG